PCHCSPPGCQRHTSSRTTSMGVDHIGITLMPNSVARARLTEASNLMEATNKEVVRAISLRALWGRCANDSRRAEHFFETLTEFPGPECIFWIRAAATFRDLFICAKYLFVEATASPQTWAGGSRPFSSEPRGRLGGVQRREAMKLPIILEHVPPQLNQGDSRGAKDGRVYRH